MTKSFQAKTIIDMLLKMKPSLERDEESLKKLSKKNTFDTEIFEIQEPKVLLEI